MKTFILFLFLPFLSFSQTKDSLLYFIKHGCDNIFSETVLDSTYCNFYISENSDTIYFKYASCIVEAQTTSPLSFKRKIWKGYAEGFLRIYMNYTDSYSWLEGDFLNGSIQSGTYLEYYKNGTFKLTGQFIGGQRDGIWTWYDENGKIQRLFIYKIGEPLKEFEYH
jgi:MORN repeat variant